MSAACPEHVSLLQGLVSLALVGEEGVVCECGIAGDESFRVVREGSEFHGLVVDAAGSFLRPLARELVLAAGYRYRGPAVECTSLDLGPYLYFVRFSCE